MYEDFGVPPEVERGIIQILYSAAFPVGGNSPFTVITRDLSLWLSEYPHQPMTLLNVSLVFPPDWETTWLSDSYIKLEVERRLLVSGWPIRQIVDSYRGEQKAGGPIADFGLLDQNGKLTAVVEVKNSSSEQDVFPFLVNSAGLPG